MIGLTKRRYRRLMVLLLIPLLILSSLWATIYVSVHTDATLEIPEEPYSVQLVAADYNQDHQRLLQKDGGIHRLDLGSWVAGTNKTFPGAFAIVNPMSRSLTIESLSLRGDPDGIQMYLHRNMTRPSNEDLVNIEKTESAENTTLYYDHAPVDVEDPWDLQEGRGYDESGDLIYENSTETATASKENEVWAYDFHSPLVADDDANFVWVEINVAPSDEVESDIYRGPLEIEIEIDEEVDDGETITYMGAGRRKGGPAIQAIEGNSVKLNMTDLKPGTEIVIPDTFALVNAGSSELRVTGIEVEGDSEGYMRIYLHGDPDSPAGEYDLPVETDESSKIYYDNETDSYDRSEDGWIMGPGLGYDGDSNLLYQNESGYSTAKRIAGYPTTEYNLWMYDPEGNNVAGQETSNFVWVEIAYVIPEDVEETCIASTITFQLSSV